MSYTQQVLKGYEVVRRTARRLVWRRQSELTPEQRHVWDAMLLDMVLPRLVFSQTEKPAFQGGDKGMVNFRRYEMINTRGDG